MEDRSRSRLDNGGVVDGIGGDDRVAQCTLEQIRTMARHEPVVYLPSHDPESAQRLERKETVYPQ
jgi:hypothetical protein